MSEDSELVVGLRDNQNPALRIDQETLDKAKKQNSPKARMGYFEDFYNRIMNEVVSMGVRSKSEKALLELDGVKAAYRQLYGRDMVQDVPELEEQFKPLEEKYKGGMIPEDDITVVIGMAARFASADKDSPQIPSKVK